MRIGLVAAVSIWTAGAVFLTARPVLGQVNLPEGFEIVEFVVSEHYTDIPSINECGQIVFGKRLGSSWRDAEIFLYDNGDIVRITNNRDRDVLPRINDNGTIVWFRGHGDEAITQVILYQNGQERVIDDFKPDIGSGSINGPGHLAWSRFRASPCPLAQDIMFWDGVEITRITPKDHYNDQMPELNDDDWIVWGHSYNCVRPWEGDIRLYRAGETIVLPSNTKQPQVSSINNLGQIAWSASGTIEFWEDGQTRVLIDWGSNPRLNNLGDVYFLRFYDENRSWDAWLYRVSKGEPRFYRLTDEDPWNTAGDINDFAEVAWHWMESPHNWAGGVRFMRRIRTGDSEFDGDIDLMDYKIFAGCMTGPGRVDRLCDCRFLDIDHDGDVDLADFARFQNAFTGS